MAQQDQPNSYVQGYSERTLSTQQKRRAETEAAFLVPFIKETDKILDVGCGPGTITTGLARLASKGATIGIDISPAVLDKAKALAAAATTGPGGGGGGGGSLTFEQGDILGRLAYADDTFDVVFASQVFGHLHTRRGNGEAQRALAEMRRVLKPGGVLATRDAGAQHFYPASCGLDRLWVGNLRRAVAARGAAKKKEEEKGQQQEHEAEAEAEADSTATLMPALLRQAGFGDVVDVHDHDHDSSSNRKGMRVGAGTTVYAGRETRAWLAWRATGQLQKGTDDAFRQSWLDAGISEAEIEETLAAVEKWVDTEGAWFVSLQCEMLAWK